MLVAVVFVAIVPVRDPNLYVMVWVKLDDALEIVIVGLLSMSALVQLMELARGIVGNVTVPPQFVEVKLDGGKLPVADIVTDLDPSALCGTMTVADIASTQAVDISSFTPVFVVVVPFIVMENDPVPLVVYPVLFLR
jgi:hypothetical protein